VLAEPRTPAVSRISALSVLGLVRVRQGSADAPAILDEALTLARRAKESQRLIPVLAARAELAWLTGLRDDVSTCAREALDALPPGMRSPWRERLTYWLWKARVPEGVAAPDDGPYARLIGGDWHGAATYWSSKGCPYEQAEALLEGDLAAATRGLEIFETLGAAPAVGWARQRLRQLGAGRLPRGRRPSTRAHPAGLTTRESEILAMLARGLRNPQIAARLFVSRKTVEHHVSSILGKLQVSSRDEAVRRARDEGWVTPT
jgi:DNA-binding CsgD family transcriptional regulator